MTEEKSSTSHGSLPFKIEPFKNKRPLFDRSIFGSAKKSRSGNGLDTTTTEGSESFLNSPKPIHLWSSPRPEPNSSNSVGRKVSKLDLNQSLSNESISNGSGYISKKGNFHSWGSDQSRFGTPERRKVKILKTRKIENDKPKKLDDEFQNRFHSEETKKVMATLERLTKPVIGPDCITFEEYKKNKPPRNEARDNRPYSWRRGRRECVTAGTQTNGEPPAAKTVTQNVPLANGNSKPAESTSGGGKIKRERTKMRDTKTIAKDEEEPETPSYDLGVVPTISVDSKISLNGFSKPNLSSSPREKLEKIEIPLPAVSKEASKPTQKVSTPALQSDKDFPLTNPKILDSNSQPQTVTGTPIDFTLSQPKKLESLSINSQQTQNEKSTNQIPESPKTSSKVEEKPKSPAPKPAVATTSGFGDLLAKQKASAATKWVCDICMVSNDISALKCVACEAPNPNAPKAAAPATSSTAPSFKFGVEKSSNAPPNVTAVKSSGFGDFMAKQKASSAKSERWSCDICMISNEKTADKCAACEAPNPKAPAKTETVSKSSFVFGVSQTEKEAPKATTSSAPSSGGFGDLLAKQKAAAASKWVCDICMVSNDASALKCMACEAPNPNAPKVSSSESKTESNSAPKFTFGIPSNEAKTSSAPSFTGFGAKPAEKKETAPPVVAAPVASAPVAPASGGFGDLLAKQKAASASKWTCDICMVSNDISALKCMACEAPNPNAPAQSTAAESTSSSAAPKFVFGVQPSAPSTEAPAKKDAPTFSFGAPAATQPAATEAPKPSFSFGAPAPAKAPEATPAPIPKLKRGRDTSSTPSSSARSSGFSFGSTAAPAKKETPSFSFGAPSATPAPTTTPAEPPKPSFSFGASAPAPAQPSGGFGFGAPKPEENKAAAPSFSFGAPKETPAPTPAGSLFGASEPKATPSFSFGGAPKQEEKPAAAPSFSFGAGGASKPAAGGFGQSSGSLFAPKAEDKQPSFNFTASKPAEQPSFSFGATQNAPPSGGSLFGAAPPQQNQAAAPSFNFGASNNAPQANAPSMFTPSKPSGMFGASNESKSSFNFSNNTGSEPFNFGASNPTPNQAPSSSIFGGQDNNGFGQANQQQQPQSSIFGNSSSQPAPSFGASNSQPSGFGAGGNSGFNFGQTGSQPTGNAFGNNSQPNAFASQPSQSNMFQPTPSNTGTPTAGRKMARARRRRGGAQ